jgi:hypothetical protein
LLHPWEDGALLKGVPVTPPERRPGPAAKEGWRRRQSYCRCPALLSRPGRKRQRSREDSLLDLSRNVEHSQAPLFCATGGPTTGCKGSARFLLLDGADRNLISQWLVRELDMVLRRIQSYLVRGELPRKGGLCVTGRTRCASVPEILWVRLESRQGRSTP